MMEGKGVKETGSSTLFRLFTTKVHTHIKREKSSKTTTSINLLIKYTSVYVPYGV